MKKTLVLVLAMTVGWGIAATAQLTGSWCTDVAINPQTPAVTSFASTLIVDYDVGGWTFASKSGLTLAGWSAQEFTAGGLLGALRLESDLIFNPAAASFTRWTANGSLGIFGVTLTGLFLLGPAGSGWTFGGSGVAGDLTADLSVFLNMDVAGALIRQTDSCMCWDGMRIHLCFPFGCIEQVCSTFSFDTSGLAGVEFCVSDIPVPTIEWLSLSACVDFVVGPNEGKSVSLTPSLKMPAGCFTLYSSILTAPGAGSLSITGLSIYGFGLSCTVGGVRFTDATSLSPSKNLAVTGDAAYWEKMRFSSVTDSCCGGAFNFDVTLWFLQTSTQLFDLGKTSIALSYGFGENLTARTGASITTLGVVEWDLGFCLSW